MKKENMDTPKPTNNNTVIVADVNMTFGSMIEFMIKWFFASILAAAVVGLLCLIPFLVIIGIAHQH
jgi:hypothetical protein